MRRLAEPLNAMGAARNAGGDLGGRGRGGPPAAAAHSRPCPRVAARAQVHRGLVRVHGAGDGGAAYHSQVFHRAAACHSQLFHGANQEGAFILRVCESLRIPLRFTGLAMDGMSSPALISSTAERCCSAPWAQGRLSLGALCCGQALWMFSLARRRGLPQADGPAPEPRRPRCSTGEGRSRSFR